MPRLRLDVRVLALRCAHDRAPAYGELRCHHCGYVERIPRQCPKCDKVELRPVGAGTERVEERLAILFPDYPVLRVDRDSTSRKDAMNQLFATIQKGQPASWSARKCWPRGTIFHG